MICSFDNIVTIVSTTIDMKVLDMIANKEKFGRFS